MSRTTATTLARARVGNVGAGFLGHVIDGPRDVTTVRRIDQPTVRIDAIRNSVVQLPMQVEHNTAGAALIALREVLQLPFGFAIELEKEIGFGS